MSFKDRSMELSASETLEVMAFLKKINNLNEKQAYAELEQLDYLY